jgi:hypothetical protein
MYKPQNICEVRLLAKFVKIKLRPRLRGFKTFKTFGKRIKDIEKYKIVNKVKK